MILSNAVDDPRSVALEHAKEASVEVGFVYGSAIKGYSGVIPSARLARVVGDPRVEYVERDNTATAFAQTIPYGVSKMGATASVTAKAGDGSGAVTNVTAYVLDTGIDRSHPDLNVVSHVNFAGGANKDCNGHGTHVAGTLAATDDDSDVVGVSPGTPLVGVKVLGCDGKGSYSSVIAGIDWINSRAKHPALVNMSLGGPGSQALDDAVRKSASSGLVYVISAGNNANNSCDYSPARVGAGIVNGVVTVAATDEQDHESAMSNVGSCVDLWAPGVNVLSTRLGGGTRMMSGTSMASAHVAGGVSLWLSAHPTARSPDVELAVTSAAQATGTMSKDGRLISRAYVAGF